MLTVEELRPKNRTLLLLDGLHPSVALVVAGPDIHCIHMREFYGAFVV